MNISKAEFDFSTSSIIILSGKSASGKSAVFDAIALCLSSKKRSSVYAEYVKQGCDYAKIDLNCIINNNPVNFNLQINLVKGTPYQMELTTNGKIYKNTEADEVLKSFDIEYYADIVFSMQSDDYRDITQLSPTQRANYLQRLLNFDFSEQKEKLKIDMDNISVSIFKINNNIELYENLIDKEEKSKEKLIVVDLTDNDITRYEEIIINNKEKIKNYEQKQKEFEKYNNDLSILKNTEIALNKDYSSIETEIVKITNKQEKVTNAENNLRKCQELIKEQNTLYEENNKKLNDIFSKVENRKIMLETLEREEKDLSTQREDIINIKKLYEEKECPICGQDITKVTQKRFDDFMRSTEFGPFAKIEDINEIIKGYEKQIITVRENIHNIILERKDLETNQDDYTKKVLSFKIHQDRYLQDEINYKQFIKDEEYDIVDLVHFNKNLEKVKQKILENKDQQKDIENKIIEYKKNNENVSLLSSEIIKYSSLIQKYNSDIKLNKEIIIKNNNKDKNIEEYQEKIKELKQNIININLQLTIFKEAFDVLDKNLPTYMILKACYTLQDEMNNFIQCIFPNYAVKLINSKKGCEFFYTKNISIQENDKKRNNAWINTKMSSGFEKALLTIAFKVALCSLYGLNIFLGDEIDGAADDESSEKLFEQLINYSIFDQLFLISHKKTTCQRIQESSSNCTVYTASFGNFTITNSLD